MQVRTHHNPQPCARIHINMRKNAPQADQFQIRQSLQQRGPDLRPFANQHQRLRIPQTRGQRIRILHMIVPDRDFVTSQLSEAGQRSKRIEIIIEDRDFHAAIVASATLEEA